jgi:hypothetical protein
MYFFIFFYFLRTHAARKTADKSVLARTMAKSDEKKKKKGVKPVLARTFMYSNNSHPLLATDYIEFREYIIIWYTGETGLQVLLL